MCIILSRQYAVNRTTTLLTRCPWRCEIFFSYGRFLALDTCSARSAQCQWQRWRYRVIPGLRVCRPIILWSNRPTAPIISSRFHYSPLINGSHSCPDKNLPCLFISAEFKAVHSQQTDPLYTSSDSCFQGTGFIHMLFNRMSKNTSCIHTHGNTYFLDLFFVV